MENQVLNDVYIASAVIKIKMPSDISRQWNLTDSDKFPNFLIYQNFQNLEKSSEQRQFKGSLCNDKDKDVSARYTYTPDIYLQWNLCNLENISEQRKFKGRLCSDKDEDAFNFTSDIFKWSLCSEI